MGKILSKIELANRVKKMLKIADINITVDVFFLLIAIFPIICVAFAIFLPQDTILFAGMGIASAILPFVAVNMKIKKRLGLFTQQLPEALGLMASSLRAGHSLLASFQVVVEEMPNPISHIFKVVVDDISLGRDTKDALDNMTQYMPGSVDLRFFITAVLIQREIGGNLAEVLDNLNYTIRERFKLIGQLNAQTAQSRLSGMVLACAPAIIGLIIWTMNPTYMEPLFKTTLGKALLTGSIGLAVMGFFIINKITDIRI